MLRRIPWFGVFIGAIVVAIIGMVVWVALHPAPEAGYVLKKNYHPAYWTTQCISRDDKGYCRTSIPVRHDPRFCLYLQDDKDKEKKGERCVDERTYEKYDVGSHYPNPR